MEEWGRGDAEKRASEGMEECGEWASRGVGDWGELRMG